MRLTIDLSDEEQRKLHAIATRERRDIRDQIVMLALQSLPDEPGVEDDEPAEPETSDMNAIIRRRGGRDGKPNGN